MIYPNCGSLMEGSCAVCESMTVSVDIPNDGLYPPITLLANVITGFGLSLSEIGALLVCLYFLQWQCLVYTEPGEHLGIDDLAYLTKMPYSALRDNLMALEAHGLLRVVPAEGDQAEHVMLIPRVAA